MWHVVMVRGSALLVGVAAIVCAAVWSVGPYQDTMAYRHAFLCPGGVPTPVSVARDCVARETAGVTGRHYATETTSDEGGSTTTTTYYVTYRRASGATETRSVVASLYHAAAHGGQAELETWHGAVIWISLAGQTSGYDPPHEKVLLFTPVLAWAGFGLLLWFVLGNGTLRQLFGNATLRPLGWLAFGGWTVFLVHYHYTYSMSTKDYVWGWLTWLLVLAMAGCAAFVDFNDDGWESLARLAYDRLRRRKKA